MKTLQKIRFWAGRHPKFVAVLRIALGLVLIWKSIAFTLNLDLLAGFLRTTGLTDNIGASVSITLLTDLIIVFQLIGGAFIAFGFRTRLFCGLNLPVLFGAVFLVGLRQNILKPYSGLWLSLPVLLAIFFFLIVGDGYRPWHTKKKREIQS